MASGAGQKVNNQPVKNVSKAIFLDAVACPTLGWLERLGDGTSEELTLGARFRIWQGQEIGERARKLFPGGQQIAAGNMDVADATTRALLADSGVPSLFEAAFATDGYAARADVLLRRAEGWHLIEVKSSVNDRDEFIDDMAYTAMVAALCGLKIESVGLMLVSRDYRLGMDDADLFAEYDHTGEVLTRAAEFEDMRQEIERVTRADAKPAPELLLECRRCDLFKECLGEGVSSHIFELPRLSRKRFDELMAMDITRIPDIPEDFPLTDSQARVRSCVLSGEAAVSPALGVNLGVVTSPIRYLDFETVMTAIPLYPDVAPYETIPTQYSVHCCCSIGVVESQADFVAVPARDCRRELAEKLLFDLGEAGSIIAYSGFEARVINGLAEHFPDLAEALAALVGRIVDLEAILRRDYYHPDFHGRSSIKVTLPVLVPEMSYDDLDGIAEGDSAAAAFAMLALGIYPGPEDEATILEQLREYCCLDTLAMVRLHQRLAELA